VVSIQDHGPGIPPEELETLFQPFQRSSVAPPDGEPGTGLGLAISRRIVEAHGGRVWAESEPGVGSVFRFSIPASEPEAARCAGGPTPAS
jgi:signal transduction histidine kinase